MSLADHPRYAAWQAELADLAEKERAYGEHVRKLWEPYHAELDAWRKAAAQAAVDGTEPPPKPTEPDDPYPPDTRAWFHAERRKHQEAEPEVLRDIAPDIEAEARSQEKPDLDELAALFAKVEEINLREQRRLADLRQVRQAVDNAIPDTSFGVDRRTAHRTRSSASLTDLAQAARTGQSLLDPLPVAPSVQDIGPVERDSYDDQVGVSFATGRYR